MNTNASETPKTWPDATGKIDLEGAVQNGDISHADYERATRGHNTTIGSLATESAQTEAHQDVTEVDPATIPIYMARRSSGGFGIEYYNPSSSYTVKYAPYSPLDVPKEERITGHAYTLMHDRGFVRTGKVPPDIEDTEAGHAFYQGVYQEMGIDDNKRKNVGMTLVRVGGFSLLSLGIALSSDNRGQLAFAAKGNRSTEELLTHASVAFSEVFESIKAQGIILGETPREVIDLTQ